ncbi:MAG: Ig-like domain-containing protein [bacterium]
MSLRITHHRVLLILAAFAVGAIACGSDTANMTPPVGAQVAMKAGSDAQTGTVGAALPQPISVHVTDANGNAAPGTKVTWTVASGGGTTSAATSTANAAGDAATTWTLGTGAGANALVATIPGGAAVTLHATGSAGVAATVTKVSGDGQTIGRGEQSALLVIKVADQYGNPIVGATVAWDFVSTGGGTFTALTITEANGQAHATTYADYAGPGTYISKASVGVLTPVTFTVTAP